MFPCFTPNTGIIRQPHYFYMCNRPQNVFDIFNEISGAFFALIDGTRNEDQVVSGILAQYDATQRQVEDDLTALLQYLQSMGYVELRMRPEPVAVPFELSEGAAQMKLVNAEIEITNRCNLNCAYCYAEANSGKKELSMEEWIRVLGSLHLTGLRSVTFSGGEPFCRKDFVDLLGEVHRKFIVSINTNGVLVDERVACVLGTLGLKAVQVSLDSMNAEMHDALRGRGTWKRAIRGIELLKQHDVPVRVSCTVTSTNETEIASLRAYCRQNGFEFSPETMKAVGHARTLPAECFSTFTDDNLAAGNSFGLLTFDTPCQASLGFAAVGCDGYLKPCNLPNDFFLKVAPGVLEGMARGPYYESPAFRAVDAACTHEATFGRQIVPDAVYDYPRCVLERFYYARLAEDGPD